MSRYVVRVTFNEGPRFLMRGRFTRRLETASRYPHPSNARQAACRNNIIGSLGLRAEIVDTRDMSAKPL